MTEDTTPTPTAATTPIKTFGPEALLAARWPMHELTDGKLVVGINVAGAGLIRLQEDYITRWRDDRTQPDEGPFVFCRDLESGRFWSSGFRPTGCCPDAYECRFYHDQIELVRVDHEIVTRTQIALSIHSPTVIIRCTVTNRSDRNRTLEVTSYQELVLQPRLAHEAHPAFSKLFVETGWLPDLRALHALRRPREADRTYPELLHYVPRRTDQPPTEVQFDSCRSSFIGRGRTLRDPAAMRNQALAQNCGIVLDPITSLRHAFQLKPGDTKAATFATSLGQDKAELDSAFKKTSAETVDALLGPVQAVAARARISSLAAANRNTLLEFQPSTNGAMHSSPKQSTKDSASAALQFDNGIGGFSEDGREYRIRLTCDENGQRILPPVPWCNVVANEQVGFITSETGVTSTWANNSREYRLTAWHNDPVSDPPSDVIYIRDDGVSPMELTGESTRGPQFWSATPSPVGHGGDYEVRHGVGYTVFEHETRGIHHEVTTFVPRVDACRVTRVRLTNHGTQARELSVFLFHEWILGSTKLQTAGDVDVNWHEDLQAFTAVRRTPSPFCSSLAFSTLHAENSAIVQSWTDAKSFLGSGNLSVPGAVANRNPSVPTNHDERDPCAAVQRTLSLASGQTVELVFLLGVAKDATEVRRLHDKYSNPDCVDAELKVVGDFWDELTGRVQVQTPSRELDLLVNGWLVYQNLSCRMWARSAFYQGGGAFGFRDQLQDASAFMLQAPGITRQQILLHAAHQFVEGDVMHWWHPPHDLGIRTRFADDLLWLPLMTAEYANVTGDRAIWDQRVPFLDARLLADDEHEVLLIPESSDEVATVFEHCCRAIDRSLRTGGHGLPLMGCGDWNDGMNRIGTDGIGESVWMGFFLVRVLDLILPIVESRGDSDRARRYDSARDGLRDALNTNAWDGDWFVRAFHDDGTTIGSAKSDECQIDALVQAWSVISAAADIEKQTSAIASVERQLVDENAGIIRLLSPPFHDCAVDPGYIKGYLPGIRENGGQYTHGVLWFVRAMALLGKGDRAARLLQMITPIRHGATAEDVQTYQTEPYVVAADVYSVAPHVGRGGWSWYTGSAGWMFRIAVEDILGIKLEGGKFLTIDPRVQHDWDEFKIRLTLPDGATYHITVRNPDRREAHVREATLDDLAVPVESGVARIQLPLDGGKHNIDVRM